MLAKKLKIWLNKRSNKGVYMPYLYLTFAVTSIGLSSVIGGFFNKKNEGVKGASSLYSFLISLAVFLFWAIVFCFDRTLNAKVIWFSLMFGAFFALYNISYILAVKSGPIALTGLFSQLSLIGATVWGFFFWGAKPNLLVIIGIILVCISIWLCLYKGKNKEGGVKFNLKWLIFAIILFVSNAGCAIVQKTEQIYFNGNYGNFFMFVATGISAITCLVLWLRDDRSEFKTVVQKSWYMPTLAGAFNGLLNFFVILLASTSLSPSVIYPVIGVGGLMIVTIFSKFAFKEKLLWWQWVGVLIGAIAVAVLSI
jgi:drug/metabolite transporter (DMT)-like permease